MMASARGSSRGGGDPVSAPSLVELRRRLRAIADPEHARFVTGFFKTGKGEYAEGDRFLGIRVPPLRALAREFAALPEAAVLRLLRSPLHEERLLALILMVDRVRRGDAPARQRVVDAYLANIRHVDNWDLVDASAGPILGGHLFERGDWSMLVTLARSEVMWERRIAIVATSYAIARGDMAPALRIAAMLLDDRHDLIHKATGWMLREVGKRDLDALRQCLLAHHARMPRTALRYAIERFPEAERRAWLTKGR